MNDKIKLWANSDRKATCRSCGYTFSSCECDFEGDDKAAITLMPILVERGYGCHLNGSLAGDFVTFDFFIRYAPKKQIESVCKVSISKAIYDAMAELLDTIAWTD